MDEENTFQILLSTDNHLGFIEKDEIRGNDSFITFEEILSISEKLNPDFILLGGDIFHENKPSLSTLFKSIELLRKYSLNDKKIKFKIVSDQTLNFSHNNQFNYSNFNDKNLNIGMPIFSIHGNHDDPIDKSNLCAIDLLHAGGLINLFGKNENVEKIEINPILFCKGSTNIALYGLGAIRNERLNRLWIQNKIIFIRPLENNKKWFNIFILHQNRVKHGSNNYLPENLLPSFLDLVIWGHEHDCRIDPEWISSSELYITQPGSSVATSLSDGESIDKYVGILKVCGKDFKIDKIKLETVRPFVTESIILQDEPELNCNDLHIENQLETFCRKKIDEMLIIAKNKKTLNQNQPLLPLLRIKIDYSGGFELFSTSRLSQQYVERVANPSDMIVLNRKKEYATRDSKVNNENIFVGLKEIGPDANRVEDIVRQYFYNAGEKMKMLLLNERELGAGVKLFVDKDNNEMVSKSVEIQIERTLDFMKRRRFTETSIDKEIGKIINSFKTMFDDSNDEENMIAKLLEEVGSIIQSANDKIEDDEDVEISEVVKSKSSTRGRGRGRGRGSCKASVDKSLMDDDIMDSDNDITINKRKYKTESSLKDDVKRKKM